MDLYALHLLSPGHGGQIWHQGSGLAPLVPISMSHSALHDWSTHFDASVTKRKRKMLTLLGERELSVACAAILWRRACPAPLVGDGSTVPTNGCAPMERCTAVRACGFSARSWRAMHGRGVRNTVDGLTWVRGFRHGCSTVRCSRMRRNAIRSITWLVLENPRKDEMNVFPAQRSSVPLRLWIRALRAHTWCVRGLGSR